MQASPEIQNQQSSARKAGAPTKRNDGEDHKAKIRGCLLESTTMFKKGLVRFKKAKTWNEAGTSFGINKTAEKTPQNHPFSSSRDKAKVKL